MLTRYDAAGSRVASLLLAHGAGAGQTHPFLVAVATRLAARGVSVATFDFAFMAAGKRRPDPPAALEARAAAALDAARAELGEPLFAGGKSMGGRILTQVAAQRGPAAALRGLVLLGYPLHPPKQPDKLRVAHLARVPAPMLFVQGTRDAFGGPSELAPHLAGATSGTLVLPIEDADHGFAVPKRSGRSAADVLDAITAAVVAFVQAHA